ncbi:MAG: hypothetical protein A2X24_07600 [Chloroflexi bacterium GWB2_54_36]|nr:MAG: hypothetical protein A2X24_07600 [Chloroflexi bacterium GWB2_54_36]
MKRHHLLNIVIVVSLTLTAAGCGKATESNPISDTPLPDSPTIEVSPAATETESPTSDPTDAVTPTPDGPVEYALSYDITARLDYSQKTAEIEQVISINFLPADIQALVLVVEPNRYPNGFLLNSIAVDQTLIENFTLAGNQLQFDLPERSSNEPLQILLKYDIKLPAIPPPSEMYKPQPYGYTERQLNLVDWYAFIPPLDDQHQWIVHTPPIFGESLVYPAADFDIQLEITGNPIPLVVAASSPAERTENQYQFALQQARTFAVSISADYEMLETEAAGVSIMAYAFPNSRIPNQAVLEYAAQAAALYTELFGPLPNQQVSIVQADFLDGMEFDGLYFVSKGFYDLYDGTINGYLSLITVHEMAHQWWFGAVGSDQAMEPWLDEGLATFAELQYLENYYPDQMDWWWAYRVNFYQPVGYIDLAIYDYPSYIAYRNATYLRSAQFLFELREQVGIEAYNAAMQRYLQQEYRKISSAEKFWVMFKDASGYPFNELRAKYFKQTP